MSIIMVCVWKELLCGSFFYVSHFPVSLHFLIVYTAFNGGRMKLNLNELRPIKSTFKLKGKDYTLNPYTLEMQSWTDERFKNDKYSGQVILSEGFLRIARNKSEEIDLVNLCILAFELLEDKSDFDDAVNFIEHFNTPASILRILMPAISECMGNAQPIIDEDELELKKPKETEMQN